MKKLQAFTLIELFVVIFIIGVLIALLLPSVSPSREQTRCMQCRLRMQRIGLALHYYHDSYKTFPPPFTVDAEGKPLHSWRTLILPFLPEDEPHANAEFEKIRVDEPWDSEFNSEFHKKMSSYFQCPSCPRNIPPTTIYKMVVGENTVAGKSLSSLKRKPSEVVLLIEAWPPVPWMSPVDFSSNDFVNAIYPTGLEKRIPKEYKSFEERNPDKKPVIGGMHEKELHILFADGTLKTYTGWKLPISEIEAMSRIREKP